MWGLVGDSGAFLSRYAQVQSAPEAGRGGLCSKSFFVALPRLAGLPHARVLSASPDDGRSGCPSRKLKCTYARALSISSCADRVGGGRGRRLQRHCRRHHRRRRCCYCPWRRRRNRRRCQVKRRRRRRHLHSRGRRRCRHNRRSCRPDRNRPCEGRCSGRWTRNRPCRGRSGRGRSKVWGGIGCGHSRLHCCGGLAHQAHGGCCPR